MDNKSYFHKIKDKEDIFKPNENISLEDIENSMFDKLSSKTSIII